MRSTPAAEAAAASWASRRGMRNQCFVMLLSAVAKDSVLPTVAHPTVGYCYYHDHYHHQHHQHHHHHHHYNYHFPLPLPLCNTLPRSILRYSYKKPARQDSRWAHFIVWELTPHQVLALSQSPKTLDRSVKPPYVWLLQHGRDKPYPCMDLTRDNNR